MDCSDRCTICSLSFLVRDLGSVQSVRENIYLVPCHPGDFFAALPCESQEFDDPSIGTARGS